MTNKRHVGVGSLVSLSKLAFETAALSWNDSKNRSGVVLDIFSAREALNIDTDELMCEVLLDTGSREIFYKQDLLLLDEQ
tara:strand:+ start:21597 stop:21836 length:240 start_codon:yes stop_codon:yes gene_type:complete